MATPAVKLNIAAAIKSGKTPSQLKQNQAAVGAKLADPVDPVDLKAAVDLTAPVEPANTKANTKAKEEANATVAAIKAVANSEEKEEANATAAAIKSVANSEAKAPSGSNASGTSGTSGPSVQVPTPGPSGSAPNAVNQQKLIKVTKDGSNYSATTLVSNSVLSDNDIHSRKSIINANTQLVKIIQNGPVITGELIQSENSTMNALADAPKPPTAKGGKYKKHTMKRKAKKSKKTRRH